MSWDQFIETQLLRKLSTSGWVGNCLESAAIMSAENAGVWACTPDFKLMRYVLPVPAETDPETFIDVEVDEAEGLIKAVNDGEPPSKAGIRVAGIKYMKLRYDPAKSLLYLRKSGGGGCLLRTKRALLFGSYSEEITTTGAESVPQSGPLCNDRIERLGEFLGKKGF